MTLDRARELMGVQADFGGLYYDNSAGLILSEVQCEHGQAVMDQFRASPAQLTQQQKQQNIRSDVK